MELDGGTGGKDKVEKRQAKVERQRERKIKV